MAMQEALVRLLADGAVHSGTDLSRRLNCSRTAVWKQLRNLRAMGLAVASMRGRGYRLEKPLDLLSRDVIASELARRAAIETLEVHGVIDSTSQRLRTLGPPAPGHSRVVLAEFQSAGRGRRGRSWLSPYASGVCLSVNWCFAVVPPNLQSLSLAAGVAVCRALRPLRPRALGLKWPNDILAGAGKLGGLLVDVQGEADGPITVIVGVGINMDVPQHLRHELAGRDALPPAGLGDLRCAHETSRSKLAAGIINELQGMLFEFGATGFAGFINEWRKLDRLLGRTVTVTSGSRVESGKVTGIGADGALLLAANGEQRRIISGEVTLRERS